MRTLGLGRLFYPLWPEQCHFPSPIKSLVSYTWRQAVLCCRGSARLIPTHEKTNPRPELILTLKLERRQQELESLLPITRSKNGNAYTCSPWAKSSTPACDIIVSEVSSSLEMPLSWAGCSRAHHLLRLSRRAWRSSSPGSAPPPPPLPIAWATLPSATAVVGRPEGVSPS